MTVRAAEDDDAMADADVTRTHTVSRDDYGSVTADSVIVTVAENDTAGVTISPTDLTIDEGSSDIYTVVLASQPTDNVTVTIGGAGGDVTASPTPLTFTTSNWSKPQAVTVNAGEDDDAMAEARVTLTHAVRGGDYEGVSADSVAVTVTENDTRA